MNYTSFMIRKSRLERNWSQDGLCKGICTASYLCKIEQGKSEPSPEIVELLFARLGIVWNGAAEGERLVQNAYELLFAGEFRLFSQVLAEPSFSALENSPWGLDYLLLHRIENAVSALPQDLEVLMDPTQLALQRILQGRCADAIRLNPCAYTYYMAGSACYSCGDSAQAVEYMYRANALASEEGYAQIMMRAREVIGSCYAIRLDLESMERHYGAARRLARSLGNTEYLEGIKYNIAATRIEAGQYEEAMAYWETQKDSRQRLTLHKLAICCEKLGRKEEALAALDRAEPLPDDSPQQMETQMCRTVRLRLTDPRYLDSEEYGQSLLKTFSLCRSNAPVGYCLFHMPWMIEWFEHHRQYKQVVSLLQEFPEYGKKSGVNK